MSKQEIRWILLYSAVLALFTSVPYLLGFSSETDEWRFTGFVYGVEDGNSYIAKMMLGSEGAWLFRTPYSTMPQSGVLAFLPYLLLGKLAGGAAIHEQLVALYHLFRISMTPLAVYATYRFVTLFIKEKLWRRWTTILVTLGGGLGWIPAALGQTSIFGSLPIDWFSPEWFGFLSFFGQPHLILARALLLLGLCEYLLSPKSPNRAWVAGIYFLLLSLIHPLSIVSAYAILAVHQVGIWVRALVRKSRLIVRKSIWSAIKAGIIPLPFTLYYIYCFSSDPFLKKWTEQNVIRSPHPIHLLIAFGVVLIPAILGIRCLMQKRRWSGMLLLSWLVALPFLAYAPHNLQRRLPEGIWTAWAIMAALGISTPLGKKTSHGLFWGVLILTLSLPTTLMILIGGMGYAMKPMSPIFRPADEVAVFNYLQKEIKADSVILSSYETGNAIPAWAHVKVVIGHGPETASLAELEPQVEAFYAGQLDQEDRDAFLRSQDVDYVFFGPAEASFGSMDLDTFSNIQLCFEKGDYRLYQRISND